MGEVWRRCGWETLARSRIIGASKVKVGEEGRKDHGSNAHFDEVGPDQEEAGRTEARGAVCRTSMVALTATMTGTAAADAGAGAQAVAPARITDVAPDGGSTGVPRETTIFVDFDMNMDTDTVFRDIRLKKKGARRAVGVTDVYMFADDT